MPTEELMFDGGGKYVGETRDGVPHGKGKFTWPHGDEYEGEWEDNVQQGKGVFRWANGDVYSGEWFNDQSHGKGKMNFASGNCYDGEWCEDRMEGKGILTYKDGRVYEGLMKNDQKHGRGKEKYTNGEYYEGEWLNGLKHGKGLYVWPNGESYDGDYVNDVKEGRGVFRWPNGDTYEGEFKEGQRHGAGVCRYSDGSFYAGKFVHGNADGKQKKHDPQATMSTIQISKVDVERQISSCSFASESIGNIDFTGWKRGNILGKGSFGQVFLGLLKNGKFVAVKTIEFGSESQPEELQTFQKELDLMRELNHKNIVRYLGSDYNKDENILNIFIEYMPQGSIAAVTKKFNQLPVSTVRIYTKQILEGLGYLHSCGIIHRDIKGDNILLDSEGCAKLADFGCSKKLDELCSKTHACNTMVGTPYWMAPEVITNDSGYSFKADVWSVGCVCIEMLTGKHPWPEFASMWAAIYHIANSSGPPPGMPKDLEPSLQEFLDLCFERNVLQRPNVEQLLKHTFLRE